MADSPYWVAKAAGARPAIPGYEYLENLACADPLASALAVGGYRLRHGQSVWLSVPVSTANDLAAVLRYLHALRASAYVGALQSRWFNKPNMSARPDLVVWTRRRQQYSRLKDDVELGVDWVRATPGEQAGIVPLRHPDRFSRTLLVQQTESTLHLCEDLAAEASPFAMVLDMTPFGQRTGPALMEMVTSYFPGVPLIVLSAVGDFEVERELGRPALASWRQPAGEGLFAQKGRETPLPRIIIANDVALSDMLLDIAESSQRLRQSLEGAARAKPAVQALNRINAGLRSLAVPLTFHEEYQDRQRRGGPYPIKPLQDWLKALQGADMPSGEAQGHLVTVVDKIAACFSMLEDGVTGKQQALLRWLNDNLKKGGRVGIGVSGERDAALIRSWLAADHAEAIDSGELCVLGVGSTRDLYRQCAEPLDKLLIIGPLWAADYWSLSLAGRADILCYPSEAQWAARNGRRWLASLAGSADDRRWWTLEPCRMEPVLPGDTELEQDLWTECSGQYTRRVSVVIDLPTDGSWLEVLMAPLPEPRPLSVTEPQDDDVVVVTDEGRYAFHRRQRVYALRSDRSTDALKPIPAEELEEGDTLVLTEDPGDDSRALLELLIQYAADNSDSYTKYQIAAGRWDDYIDHATTQLGGTTELHRALAGEGVDVDPATVRLWAHHTRIGPGKGGRETSRYIFAVAKLAKMAKKEDEVLAVANAITEIRSLHRRLGKVLRSLIVSAGVDGAEVIGSLAGIIAPNILSDLVHLALVEQVISFPHQKPGDNRTLDELLREHVEISDRIIATPRAIRSARDSNFGDLRKAEQCLSLLENEFYRVFTGESRLPEAEKAAARQGISYAANMSSVTQGQHSEYNAKYKGRSVDMGRHLRIGATYDPEYCFRLHFHWDPEDNKIVVLHFGRHLPTRK